MKINLKLNKFLVILIVLVGLVSVPLSFTEASSGVSLFLSPAGGDYKVGELINVSVMVNTGDETINAIKATLNFSENLEVQSVSKSGSIFGLWVEDPSYDNTAKTISFGGAGAGTTYKGSAGKLISVTLKANRAGEETVKFTSSLVKYGGTTIEVKSISGGNYAVNVPISQPQDEEVQESVEKPVLAPKETIKESTPTEEEIIEGPSPELEKVVAKTTKEGIPQRSLLADLAIVWGGTSQLALLIVITSLCLIALVFIGFKEWKKFQKKKNN